MHICRCSFPLTRWAGGLEDKYFARLAKGAIKIYETPEMTQLDKKDLKLEGVQVRVETTKCLA
jgi:translation initiation factor 3 subunit B